VENEPVAFTSGRPGRDKMISPDFNRMKMVLL